MDANDLLDRRARIVLPRHTFQEMLDLPEGVHIHAVEAINDPAAIVVHVVGEALPVVPDFEQSPRYDGIGGAESIVVERKVYRRWTWQPTNRLRRS